LNDTLDSGNRGGKTEESNAVNGRKGKERTGRNTFFDVKGTTKS